MASSASKSDTSGVMRGFEWFAWVWIASGIFIIPYMYFTGKDASPSPDELMWASVNSTQVWQALGIIPALTFNMVTAKRFGGMRTFLGRTLIFLSLGLVSWSIGNLIWYYFNTCTASGWGALGCDTAIDVPYPSIADFAYLGLLPMYAIGLINLARTMAITVRDAARLVWLPIVITIATAYGTVSPIEIGSFTFGKSWLFAPDYSAAATIVSYLYVLSDITILSLGILILLKARHVMGGLFMRPAVTVAVSLCLLYAADLVFFARVAHETYYNGDLAFALYSLSFFAMVYAWHQFAGVSRTMTAMVADVPIPSTSDIPTGSAAS